MARVLMENIRGLPDFLTVYNWNVAIIRAPAGIIVPANFNFQCQTSTIPSRSDQPAEIDIRGHKVRQAGVPQYDQTLDLQFVETDDTALMRFFHSWKEAQWQTGTGVQRRRNEANVDLQLQLDNRQGGLVRTFEIRGGILINTTLGDLSGDQTEVLRPTATIQYDYFVER